MNKTVLITGASRGIGKAIALYLASLKYNIVVHYNTNRQAAEEVLKEIKAFGSEGRLLSFDIANREQTKTILEQDIITNGSYYGVICNAGINKDNPFPLLSSEDWDSVIHTNLDGLYNVLQPVVMPMIEARMPGRIIAISSISGIIGNRGQVNYSASKAGIIGAMKSLAVELAKRNITVNCVAPGIIETDMTADLPVDEVKKIIPMKRVGLTKEVASLVAYLLSDDASYITRQVISVNGGMF